MYLLSRSEIIDTLMHRYGADCFGAASYFYRLRPRPLATAIEAALKQNAEEMLFLRWCISGGGESFAEFRQRIFAPKKAQTAEEIHRKLQAQTKNIEWRRVDGC